MTPSYPPIYCTKGTVASVTVCISVADVCLWH